MMGLSGVLQKTLCRTLFLFLSLAAIIVGTHGLDYTKCNANTSPPEGNYNFTADSNDCFSIQVTSAVTSTLWYQLENSTGGTTLSVILRAPKQKPPVWYGMGFNEQQSQMPGTSAIIFWLNSTSSIPVVNTYKLTATDTAGVTVDSTALTYKSPPKVTSTTDSLYLEFDVVNADTPTFNYQNFVIGTSGDIPPGDRIASTTSQHQMPAASFQIDFKANEIRGTSSDIDSKARTHGILNIIGWGVLLPLGAIVARYLRSFDPHWFYAHAVLQVVGYVFVVAGLATGVKLLDDVHKANPGLNADTHKALAILVFVLATIQITAALIRPKREAKLRRYWNWGHWWLGRIALAVAIVNIFIGIHLAKAGKRWKVAYGIILAVEILLVIVLEPWLWIKYFRSKKEPSIPQTAMGNRGPPNGVAPSAPPPNYESSNWDSR